MTKKINFNSIKVQLESQTGTYDTTAAKISIP